MYDANKFSGYIGNNRKIKNLITSYKTLKKVIKIISFIIVPLGILLFLRQREIVHFARFKELLEYYEKKNML